MKERTDRLVIMGVGGHALSVWDIAEQLKIEIVAFIDPSESPQIIKERIRDSGKPVIDSKNYDNYLDYPIFIGVGDNTIRNNLWTILQEKGATDFPNLISPSAYISKNANLGKGNYVGNGSNIGTDSVLGNFNILNSKVSIDHENHISNCSSLGPGAITAGQVRIGSMTFLGMSSSVRQGVEIGSNCLIGAHSYVKDAVPDNAVSWGVPAKIQRFRSSDDYFDI